MPTISASARIVVAASSAVATVRCSLSTHHGSPASSSRSISPLTVAHQPRPEGSWSIHNSTCQNSARIWPPSGDRRAESRAGSSQPLEYLKRRPTRVKLCWQRSAQPPKSASQNPSEGRQDRRCGRQVGHVPTVTGLAKSDFGWHEPRTSPRANGTSGRTDLAVANLMGASMVSMECEAGRPFWGSCWAWRCSVALRAPTRSQSIPHRPGQGPRARPRLASLMARVVSVEQSHGRVPLMSWWRDTQGWRASRFTPRSTDGLSTGRLTRA